MATHSSILAWKIPWTEEPSKQESRRLQRVGPDWGRLPTHLPTHPDTVLHLVFSFNIKLCMFPLIIYLFFKNMIFIAFRVN